MTENSTSGMTVKWLPVPTNIEGYYLGKKIFHCCNFSNNVFISLKPEKTATQDQKKTINVCKLKFYIS